MGKSKRQNRSKRSLASLPKGLVHKDAATMNPFEEMASRQKKPKQIVHNRPVSKAKTTKNTLESLQRRQTQLRSTLKASTKVNSFVDRRIGQYDPTMSKDDQMLARLVRERSRQSKRQTKFQLDDDGDDAAAFGGGGSSDRLTLTHKGKALDPNQKVTSRDVNLLSDDEDDDADRGNLAAVDTELHFGGGRISSQQRNDPYGGGSGAHHTDLSQVYSARKTELDDLILRRKMKKAERMETKEGQVDKIDQMDESFAELSALLRFRKNEPPPAKGSAGPPKPTQEEIEMNEWQRDMRQIMSKPKHKASDRTKTPEEKAKEQAEKLHELETRRLARMNGDFSDDDFSDISVNGDESNNKKSKKNSRKKKKDSVKDKRQRNPDELDDSENEEDDGKLEARFTSEGLVYIDKDGKVVKKLGDKEPEDTKEEAENSSSDEDDEDGSDEESEGEEDNDAKDEPEETKVFHVGDQIRGNFHAAEQFDGREAWYEGVIAKVHVQPDGSQLYDVEYDDGDCEEDMTPKNIRLVDESAVEEEDKKVTQKELTNEEQLMQRKRKKARDKARHEIPYVFEVPTTLEALHELIAKYAETGEDASLIIQRIHTSNSVRLDRRNVEKMQNYYDVLLRRFVAVGDAIFESGDGGTELGRYRQLDILTKVMFGMAQDAPDTAGAVWSRRLGIFQNAQAKRMRDADFLHVDDGDDDNDNDGAFASAWPSTGTFLLLRALGHVFPVTDSRHYVVTPTILLLGQMVAHTPILSLYDVVMGVLCSGLILEYSKEAKRVAPEALGFLAGVVRLFAPPDSGHFPVPSLEGARHLPVFESLRERAIAGGGPDQESFPRLSMERSDSMGENSQMPTAILVAALNMIERTVATFDGAFTLAAEPELFSEVSESLVSLCPKTKEKSFPKALQRKISSVASSIAKVCPSSRAPLSRRLGPSIQESVVKSLAPRMEDPSKYSMSKDKGKKSVQAAVDRTRREYKREHKAISRELRLDAAFIETERRKDKETKDSKARAKRQKNFAWLEGEQESMNQQVRQGGGLLRGGGTGLARAKASTAKMGIKKGGKF